MFALVITLFFNQNPIGRWGSLPAVCNQGLFAFLVSTSSRAGYQLTGPFSGMIFARGLASRPAICAGSPPVSPSLLGSNHKTRQKWGGRKGQKGGVLGPPFLGFRAFTKQGLLKFSLVFCVTSSNLPGSVVCVCFQILVNLLLATLLIY